MKAYIAMVEISQDEYTEGKYYTSAQPATELAGVFRTEEAAWEAAYELKAEVDVDTETRGFVTPLVSEWELDAETGCFVPSM